MGLRDRAERAAIDAWCAWDARTSAAAADDEEGSTTVEYAIGAIATAVILIRVWNMLCWRADSRSLVRVVRVPSM